MFTNSKKKPLNLPSIIMFQDDVIESVSSYKNLRFLIYDSLSFKTHVQLLKSKKVKADAWLLYQKYVFLLF